MSLLLPAGDGLYWLRGGVIIKIVKQSLRQALSRRQRRSIVEPSRVRSAVLLPIYCKDGQYYLLFTKRTESVREHKGQISFPGGAYEEGDGTLMATALRESAEEIGLVPADVEVLGSLDDMSTFTTGYTISPFVAFIPWPYQFKLDREEVDEIIEVPVSALLDKDFVSQETEVIEGNTVTSYYYRYGGRVIWGATARIVNQFLEILARVIK